MMRGMKTVHENSELRARIETQTATSADATGLLDALDRQELRITQALELVGRFGGIDGAHHKQWCLDQVVRALLGGDGAPYRTWVASHEDGEDGPQTYEWITGIAP